MNARVVALKMGRRFVAVQLLKAENTAIVDMNDEFRRQNGAGQQFCSGTHPSHVRGLLGERVRSFPTLGALMDEHPEAERDPAYDLVERGSTPGERYLASIDQHPIKARVPADTVRKLRELAEGTTQRAALIAAIDLAYKTRS